MKIWDSVYISSCLSQLFSQKPIGQHDLLNFYKNQSFFSVVRLSLLKFFPLLLTHTHTHTHTHTNTHTLTTFSISSFFPNCFLCSGSFLCQQKCPCMTEHLVAKKSQVGTQGKQALFQLSACFEGSNAFLFVCFLVWDQGKVWLSNGLKTSFFTSVVMLLWHF